MTAADRRAAGEAEFCDCESCRRGALDVFEGHRFYSCRDEAAAMLRALVVQALLDPATWARPKGWWCS